MRKELANKWESSPEKSTSDRWNDIDEALSEAMRQVCGLRRCIISATTCECSRITYKNPKKKEYATAKRDIMLQSLYPRMDENVSLQMNHLLKSPFCVHPQTGMSSVCATLFRFWSL